MAADLWRVVASVVKLCDGQVVFIGGVAVYAHAQKRGLPPEMTHDVDASITIAASGTLRDKKLLTPNKRLKKAQITIDDVEVDIYVEHQNKLRFDYTELAMWAERVSIGAAHGIQIASPGHLLLLKLDALHARASSPHGAKDRRDIAKILVMIADDTADDSIQILVGNVVASDVSALQRVLKSTAFMEIARGNAQAAARMRVKAENVVARVRKERGS